ncbi:MFS transporter [Thiohalobacter sp. IOR34]|uniref:MFS transporter n=1 Tax=Thiohalobacter sp. IOR34 TaxID=3057176 RepID=UPI0025B14D53|nr:MFS transporter [Thiohalobacter sp. IOR34]WJW74522.1 MFS transporter [Thiohalobacter sp. IOR34]
MPPYWRLSGFYFFYFASLGALVPYWSLYLKALGFGGAEIGELIAILMATKLVAPNVWGWIADHSGRRMAIIRSASLLSVLAFAAVFWSHGYWPLALVMAGFSFFWNASLPQFEAVTLSHLGSSTHRYSSIRLWGSIGFILAVAGLGPLLDRFGAGLLPGVLLGLFAAIWVASLGVPEAPTAVHHREHEPLRRVLRRREVWVLLLVCFLMQASHGPYYTFYTLYMEEAGYSRGQIGQLWALGVIAEIGVFLVMHRWLPRFGARRLLLSSLLLTTLRWLLIGAFPDRLPLVLLAQSLHAASFGIYHAVAIHLVHRLFVGRNQGRGQALYSSLSFGAGGAAGSLAAGYVWAGVGHAATYYAAALLSGAALLLAWRGRLSD